jgi:hypothetical protein
MQLSVFAQRAKDAGCEVHISGVYWFVHKDNISVKINPITQSVWIRTESGINASESYRLCSLAYASKQLKLSRK